jgi:hypothetical protein
MPDKTNREEELRARAITEHVHFSKPLAETVEVLSSFPYDFTGTPFKFESHHLLSAFDRTKKNLLSFEELSLWAETLEFRDDVLIKGQTQNQTDAILNAILLLATPELSDLKGQDLVDYLSFQVNQSGDNELSVQ